jgi:hypothetical protein
MTDLMRSVMGWSINVTFPLVSLRGAQRRGNLNDGYGIIVNLTIIHPGANAAITTLLTGENGEITSSARRSHEIT